MTEGALIAIIDDDASIRAGVSSLLRSAGYKVELYESSEQFLEHSMTPALAVVVTDIQMSGMSGLELQDVLRSAQPSLPVLIMTAFPEPSLRSRAMANGAVCFLSKPFNAEELLGCIERVLGI
jgi:FixJ family two-component response regulator